MVAMHRGFGTGVHRPEFIQSKTATAVSNPLLLEEYGSGRGERSKDRNEEGDDNQCGERNETAGNIDHPFPQREGNGDLEDRVSGIFLRTRFHR